MYVEAGPCMGGIISTYDVAACGGVSRVQEAGLSDDCKIADEEGYQGYVAAGAGGEEEVDDALDVVGDELGHL